MGKKGKSKGGAGDKGGGKGKRKGRGKQKGGPNAEGIEVARGVVIPISGGDLRTVFEKEPDAVIQARKVDASRPLTGIGFGGSCVVSAYPCPVERCPDDPEDLARAEALRPAISLPLPRPAWEGLPPAEVNKREEDFFVEWLSGVYREQPRERLNFFEHNLEVWRQIWRTTERADVFLLILDARMPLLHFGASMHRFLAERHKREAGSGEGNVVVVINKVDVVPQELVDMWVKYLSVRAPGVPTVPFWTPKSGSANIRRTPCVSALLDAIGSRRVAKRVGDCEPLRVAPATSFFTPRTREDEDIGDGNGEPRFRQPGTLTVALMGDPNMGKSSIVNAIFGKKVVSSSATPGHTKRFQTLFLPMAVIDGSQGSTLSNVCFVDSPGVVVPKLDVPRSVQVVFGSYRIADVREPYSVVRWLVESGIGLIAIFKLAPHRDPEGDDDGKPWTPLMICQAYGRKRGFVTKRGEPDAYRAANFILRDVLNARSVVACYVPPGLERAIDGLQDSADLLRREPDKAEDGEDDGEDDGKSESEDGESNSSVSLEGNHLHRDEGAEDQEGSADVESAPAPAPAATRGGGFGALMSDSESEDD